MSKQLDVLDIKGKKIATKKLSDAVFGTKVSPKLLTLAVRVYLSNQRQGTKHVLSRSEVSLTKRKAWRQKGTGNARHGARSAPLFVGGGKAHGPVGNEHYRLSFPKKMRRRALIGALGAKLESNELLLVNDLSKLNGKTKPALALLKGMLGKTSNRKVLIVLDSVDETVLNAFSNISTVTITQVSRLNSYELLQHSQVIMTSSAVDYLENGLQSQTTKKVEPVIEKVAIKS